MIPENYQVAIKTIHDNLKDLDLPWVITGSLGFALQGMVVEINDIDLQTDRAGACRIEEIFKSNVTKKISFKKGERITSYFGELCINNVTVEIMGALQKKLPNSYNG